MKVEAGSIEELIKKSPDPLLLKELDAFIHKEFPGLDRYFVSNKTMAFIGYGPMTYQGKNEDGIYWPLLVLAPQKNNVSLYITGKKENIPILDFYKDFFAKSALGKGCIRYRNIKALNPVLLKDILTDAVKWHEDNLAKDK